MSRPKLYSLFENNLFRNILVVAGGTAGAQAIGMLLIPIITRIYGPETYGTLGVFISITSIFTTLSTLAYPIAIVLPSSDEKAKYLIKLSIVLSCTMSSIALLTFLFSRNFIVSTLSLNINASMMLLIPIVMFIASIQDIAQQWLIRKSQFRSIATVSISHAITNQGLQLIGGLYSPSTKVLLLCYTLAITIRSVLTSYFGRNTSTKEDFDKKSSLKSIAYEYRDFPIYRAPQILLNSASQSLPVIMLATFFGASYAGFYTLTRTVLGLPATLIGSSVQSVFYPHLNQSVLSDNRTLPIISKATGVLIIIGVWPFLIVILFGPFLFQLVFGAEWSEAGRYAQWLSIWLFFNMINRPAISAIPVFRMQQWFMYYEFFSLFFRILGIYIGFTYFSSALIAVAIFSMISAVISIIILIKVFLVSLKIDRSKA